MAPAIETGWYLRDGENERGPFSFAALTGLVAAGTLEPETMVRGPGDESWRPAASVLGLFPGKTLDAEPVGHEDGLRADARTLSDSPPRRAGWGRRIAGYFGRHWRGELSLAVSYWRNGILMSLGVVGIVAGVAAIAPDLADPRWGLLVYATGWLCASVGSIWLWVGIWRSARHARRTRKSVWAIVAQTVIVIRVVGFAAQIVQSGYPVTVELARAATGDTEQPPNRIRVIRGGTELELDGFIRFGLEERLNTVLAEVPTIKTLHLTSPGGRTVEATKLAGIVRAHGLATYVPLECASACTQIFVAGRERWIAPNAKLGFHRAALPGNENPSTVNDDAKRQLLAAGVARSFADHAYATPSDKIWYPTVTELKDAHVVTGVAGPDRFAVSGNGDDWTAEMVEEQVFAKTEVYQAVRISDPADYVEMRDRWLRTLQGEGTLAEVSAWTRAKIKTLMHRRLSSAPDEAVAAFTTLMIDEFSTIQARDAAVCDAFAGSRFTGDITHYLTPEETRTEMAVTADIILGASRNPQSQVDDAHARALFVAATGRLQAGNADPQAVWATISSPASHEGTVCPALVAVFRAALAMPPHDGADLIRVLLRDWR